MLNPLSLVKFRSASKLAKSHSFLVDCQQVHIRNFFLFCFGLSVARQLTGENILCLVEGQSQSYVDTRCFINGTFTDSMNREENTRVIYYHSYYQWISVYLLCVAISFSTPYYCWFRLFQSYLNEISVPTKKLEEAENVFYTIKISKGNRLFWKTWVLEMVYAICFITHILMADIFFNGLWSQTGWSLKSIPIIFPHTGKCHFSYILSVETEGKYTCFLPLNSVYRKIFWLVYMIVMTLSITNVLTFMYRIFLLVKIGPKYIDIWWATKIAYHSTEIWILKKFYDSCLKNNNNNNTLVGRKKGTKLREESI
jgi:hypothetical protein